MKILAIGDFHGRFSASLRNRLKSEIKKEKIELMVALGDYTGLPEWRPIVLKQLRAGKNGQEIPSHEELMGKKKYKNLLKRDYSAGKLVLKELNKLKLPCLVIFGNGDWYKAFFNDVGKFYENEVKKLKNLRQINYKKIKFKEFSFIGWGGYMDIDSFFNKKEWKNADDIESIKAKLERRNKCKAKFFKNIRKTKQERIFVLHYPPKGAFDIIQGGKKNVMTGKSAGIGFFTEAIRKYNPKIVFCGHMHEYQGLKKFKKTLIINPGDAERNRFAIVDTESLKVKFFR